MIFSSTNRAFLAISAVAAVLLIPGVFAQPNVPDVGVPETDGPVNILLQNGNSIYVGGQFTTIGGVSRNNLAAFDAITGVVDPNWDPNITGSPNAGVYDLAIVSNRIHAGGIFTTANGSVGRNNLAAFELAGGGNTGVVDSAWDPDITGGFPQVTALEASGSLIYVAGYYTTVNGSTLRYGLASFPSADGSSTGTATSWDPNLNNPIALSLAVDGSTVYVGGLFTAVNGTSVSREGVAAVDGVTGVADALWDPDLSFGGGNAQINSLLVVGPRIYIGGQYDTANASIPRGSLSAFELANGSNTGLVDSAWNPDLSSGGGVTTVLSMLAHGSKLYVGGIFTTVGSSLTRNSAAAFNPADGSSPAVLDAWDPNASDPVLAPSAIPIVKTLLPSGTGLFMGGNFTKVGGIEHNHLVGFGSTVPVEISVFDAD